MWSLPLRVREMLWAVDTSSSSVIVAYKPCMMCIFNEYALETVKHVYTCHATLFSSWATAMLAMVSSVRLLLIGVRTLLVII